MKKMSLLATAVALTMGWSAVAQAQPQRDRDDRRGPPSHSQSQHNRPAPDRHGGPPGHGPSYGPGHGAGPDHRWVKGSRVPPQYRSHHYVVNDWRGHHLHAPPRGYHWVQYGSDYLLVAIASGVVAQLILGGAR